MKFLGPTPYRRLNEAAAFVFLFAGIFLALAFASYSPLDPSWDVAASATRAHNLTGFAGAWLADFLLQAFGLSAFVLPMLLWMMGWKWIRSRVIEAPFIRTIGGLALLASVCTAFGLGPAWRPWGGAFASGGVAGDVIASSLLNSFNTAGSMILTAVSLILSLYLVSTFSMATVDRILAGPSRYLAARRERWRAKSEEKKRLALERKRLRDQERAEERAAKLGNRRRERFTETPVAETHLPGEPRPVVSKKDEDIPIQELEYTPPPSEVGPIREAVPEKVSVVASPAPRKHAPASPSSHPDYRVPSTALLNEVPARGAYDGGELKEIAARIKSKFDEFNVLGQVVQINPGPVVTTFEFKPEAGIKYSRITSLTEDLCLGLQAESILIERIPGKPTVGIEVPNSRREVISLRQILESDEFSSSASKLTICLGKDINGRIKVAALEGMPHLLIAGSTGSGKSVMLNSLIMSVLYKATPDDVRMIMVDPKRVELGIYEGIPHLLTPVITDAKKATNALRNAVLEMDRRLKLLAAQGVRNIDQYNRKIRQMMGTPRSLFEEEDLNTQEELKPLPYILILIDELADLMMLERANVEEAVTRLAQMARAVGMHLVLATQRPSVDVITGLIKANFPSRISFRVATRVDSRTVLDVMGAEHLLGKGDMLFLPPGSSRLTRVHGAYVTEAEINRAVEFWKEQARPDYDQTFLMAPPADEGEDEEAEEFDGTEDPMYQDAVRVVLEMGKASTSTLQRRLRLGYGRAARILDMMQREGIIGPPDGSKPREVLKRPDWLSEVENQMR